VQGASGGMSTGLIQMGCAGSQKVLYRWHPWYGRTVWIFNTVEKTGETILRCALDSLETARVSEVPQWMFDPLACSRITFAIDPVVTSVGGSAVKEQTAVAVRPALAHGRPK